MRTITIKGRKRIIKNFFTLSEKCILWCIALSFCCLSFSCNKSIVGTKWYAGHTYHECQGTLLKANPKDRYSIFK